ncbi:MAG: adenylate/guanylate cyclase domain-containing protein [Cyclobacteriaceae bacterium]|nr:adenylate/guanylate cyclase domain-containing protein [Cyclobacteriaceae bacterium HetDA_MAG_MS6]
MIKITPYIPVLLIYLVGIDLYFCLWYLGSEGDAINWAHGDMTFFQILTSSNIAVFFTMYATLWIRKLTRSSTVLNTGVIKIEFLVQCFSIAAFFTGILLMIHVFYPGSSKWNSLTYFSSTTFLSLSMYHFVLASFILATLNLRQRFGSLRKTFTYLFKIIYYPQTVDRGFMFLDLNDSTTIAERLDSKTYSSLLRDCFGLLDKVLIGAKNIEVYQYVGDEAVLHWDFNDRSACSNALKVFELFKELVVEKKAHFLAAYGLVPTFKGAIHGGSVTQSELGQRIIHTAFHGDVLNTTSRILDSCHHYQTDLLLSEAFYSKLFSTTMLGSFEKVEDVFLIGKVQRLTIYKSINQLHEHQNQSNYSYTLKMTNSH